MFQKEGWQLQGELKGTKGKLEGTNGDPGNQGKKDDAADPESAARDKGVQEPQDKGERESDVELEQVRETATHLLGQRSVTQRLGTTT